MTCSVARMMVGLTIPRPAALPGAPRTRLGRMARTHRAHRPLPASGERPTREARRARGSLNEHGPWSVPLTRIAARSDLSPQAGRGGVHGSVSDHTTAYFIRHE